ncbi:MAG: hypothetical protein OWS74_02675 [Firmicutes bacterium]|nr:hypothetical protein [Bacillota bacterium]
MKKNAPLTREQIVQHLTPPDGIVMPPYPAARDKVYRTSLTVFNILLYVLAGINIGGFSKMVLLTGQWAAALALTVAAWTFLVWLSSWRWTVRLLALAGFILTPFVPVLGWAGMLSASGIMAAKETHCFHFWSGRVIPWVSLGLGIFILLPVPSAVRGVIWLGLALLWTALLKARARLPLFSVE